MDQQLSDFVTRLGHARTCRDVWAAWHELLGSLGFAISTFGHVRPEGEAGRLVVDNFESNWPPELEASYAAAGHQQVDPIVRTAFSRRTPVATHIDTIRRRVPKKLLKWQEGHFPDADTAYLTVPVPTRTEGVWIFNASGLHRPDELAEVADVSGQAVQLAAYACESRLRALAAVPGEGAGGMSPCRRVCARSSS